jgi:SAM-dependent methyltransferase
MAHPEQLKFVSLVIKYFADAVRNSRVLEIGSYDVNGSVRQFFEHPKEYIGADLTKGPGVDIVQPGHEIDYADGYFDVTISCECFEHNPHWLPTFTNMIRMTKAGGLVAFTCASSGRLEHGTRRSDGSLSPGTTATGIDYYKNLTQKDFEKKIVLGEYFDDYRFFYIKQSHDLYFIGIKKGSHHHYQWDAFEKEVAAIRHILKISILNQLLYQIPLKTLYILLNERWYQTCGLLYEKTHKAIKQKVCYAGRQP